MYHKWCDITFISIKQSLEILAPSMYIATIYLISIIKTQYDVIMIALAICKLIAIYSYFLYQKLNDGRNGHFMQFNCCWYRLWIFYLCPRFLIAAHDLRWHVRDTNNIAFSVLHVWICMRLSIQNCLLKHTKQLVSHQKKPIKHIIC